MEEYQHQSDAEIKQHDLKKPYFLAPLIRLLFSMSKKMFAYKSKLYT